MKLLKVKNEQVIKSIRLIIKLIFIRLFNIFFMLMIKNTTWAIRNGIVNNSFMKFTIPLFILLLF